MREIKFRVWDKVSESMEYEIAIGKGYGEDSYILFLGLGETFIVDRDVVEIMQYSGFKIKNREVYEGDIVKGRKNTVYKVVFERGCFFLYHLNLFNPDKTNLRWGLLSRLFDSDMIDVEKACEIIGNIYENKNLIAEVK